MNQPTLKIILWRFLRGGILSIPMAGSLIEQLLYGTLDDISRRKQADELHKILQSLEQLEDRMKTLDQIAHYVENKVSISEENKANLNLLTSEINRATSATKDSEPDISPEIENALYYGLLNLYLTDLSKALVLWRGLILETPISIEEIYVKTTFSKRFGRERQQLTDEQFKETLFLRSHHSQNLLIEGPPGSGKSTYLHHFAISQAQDSSNLLRGKWEKTNASVQRNKKNEEEKSSKYIPIFLPMTYVETQCLADGKWTIPIPELVARRYLSFGNDFSKALSISISKVIASGKAVILLDAVDEISKERHKQIKDWLNIVIMSARGCPIILTSRPIDINKSLQSFYVYHIEPFEYDKQNSFIERWFDSFEETKRADEMIKYLNQPYMYTVRDPALSGNPLFLTMMCMEYMLENKISPKPAMLVEHFTQILLEEWPKHKGSILEYGLDIKCCILEWMASFCFEYKKRARVSSGKLIDQVATALQKHDSSHSIQPNEILTEIATASGLIVRDWYGMWQFSHFVFQEFFTARFRWRLQLMGEDQTDWYGIISWDDRYENVKDFYSQLMEAGGDLL